MSNVPDFPTEQSRWAALVARDETAAAAFLYAVKTTGVYCRPGCSSRLPRRENVEFFDSRAAAEEAGYRACKRCKPDGARPRERQAALIARACRTLEEAEQAPALEALAADAGLSAWHFQRLFKQIVGVTPKQYAAAHRMQRFREELKTNESVTEAIYEAGFGSSSSAYDSASGQLGMTPSAYRRGGAGLTIRHTVVPCALGSLMVAATDRGVCAIEFGDDVAALRQRLAERFPGACLEPADAAFEADVQRVAAFVDAPSGGLDLPLDIQGTAFQQQVWNALRDIPAGITASYAEVAERIGRPSAARAVAQACAANTLAVAVPCHRVVRSDGELGGYRWGESRKRALLERERARASREAKE